MSNLDLWLGVEKTDTKYTKTVNQRGGYTAIDPAYQAKEATKQFGAYGQGWGLSKSEFDYTLLESYGLITHVAEFFYTEGEKIITFPITNAISPGKKERPDTDWAKKVETNTVSKALSKLGFNADVFLGKFEDANYVGMIRDEQAIEDADDKNAEQEKQRIERREWLNKQITDLNEARTVTELEGFYGSAYRKLQVRQDSKSLEKLTSIYQEMKSKFGAK